MFGPRELSDRAYAPRQKRPRHLPVIDPHQDADAINFNLNKSFDGWMSIQARGEKLRLVQYGESFSACTGRRFELRTVLLPGARQRAFWREIGRLGVWGWPLETLPGGCDGASFEVELRYRGREVTAGWWIGGPSRPARMLCGALQRLSGRPIVIRI
jgi:hypothetical protein